MKTHQSWIKPASVQITTTLAAIAVALVSWPADASADAPYRSIAESNPFRLKPPIVVLPPVPADPPVLPLPVAAVELTGIVSVLAREKACLEIIAGPGRPLLKPVLAEGETFESVEVLSIDIARNQVVVRIGPVTTNLTFRVARASVALLPPLIPPVAREAFRETHGFHQPNRGRFTVQLSGGMSGAAQEIAPGKTVHGRMSSERAVVDLEKRRQANPSLPYPPTVLSPRAPGIENRR